MSTLTLIILITTNIAAASFNISSAHIVALQPRAAHVLRLAQEARVWLDALTNSGEVVVHRATNASEAATGELPISMRMALLQGRHSHSEIGSTAALGCLLSHVAIWRTIRDGETIAVFEEVCASAATDASNATDALEQDAQLDLSSIMRTVELDQDMGEKPWEIIMLETGHITVSGEWRHWGAHLAACAPAPMICEWHGSRGYLIHYRGAQILLAEALLSHVQTDALFWMLAAIEPNRFRMYWTTRSVAHSIAQGSSVWDRCIKCYVPLSPVLILCWAVLGCVGIVASVNFIARRKNEVCTFCK